MSSRRLEPKWLEIFSIGTTLVSTVGGWLLVVSFAHWALPQYSFCWSNTATDYVADLIFHPPSLRRLGALVPTALAFLGASARGRGHKLMGPALLVVAPQLALLQIFLALAALALPFTAPFHQ